MDNKKEFLKLGEPRCFSVKTGKEVINKPQVPKECEPCINKSVCLREGFAKNKIDCLARINKPKVNTPSLLQNNTKEDGFPPITKVMGIQPTFL